MNHESMIQRSNESTNQYNKEQISQRIKSISESVNERITWIKKSVNQWTEWMGEGVDGCMSELISLLLLSYFLCWATSSLSDLFAEASLLSATSSLSSLLSALLLLWAASHLPLLQLQLLQHKSSLRAASTVRFATSSFPHSTGVVALHVLRNYLSRIFYIAFSNLRLQSRTAAAFQHIYITLSCAYPCHRVLSQTVASPQGRKLQDGAADLRKQRPYFGDPRSHPPYP